MASDEEIAEAVVSVLRQLDPNSGATTFNDVVIQLESRLGHSLQHKTGFIRDVVNNFLLRPQPPPPPQQQQQHVAFWSHHYQPQHFQNVGFRFPTQFHAQHFRQDLNFETPPMPPLLAQSQQRVPAAVDDEGLTGNMEKRAMGKQSAPAPVLTKRKGGPGGLNKVCGVTPELQAVVGQPALARTEIVKQLWAYIRKNNLQDPSNKRNIICDDALRKVFKTDCTDMFKMNKLLSKHIIPLEPSKESSQAKKLKVEAEESVTECVNPAASRFRLSEALVRFFGTEEKYMTQSEAMQQVWDYIKDNQLEDPSNPMAVLCDSKLQDLIGCPSISALGILEMLKSHHLLKE